MWNIPEAQPQKHREPQPSAALAAVREEAVQVSLAAEQCCPSEEGALCGADVCLPGMRTAQRVAASRSRNIRINPGCVSLSGFVLDFNGVVGFFFKCN